MSLTETQTESVLLVWDLFNETCDKFSMKICGKGKVIWKFVYTNYICKEKSPVRPRDCAEIADDFRADLSAKWKEANRSGWQQAEYTTGKCVEICM